MYSICFFSHFSDHTDHFHKQTGAFTLKTVSVSGDRKILARRSADDQIHRIEIVPAEFCDISVELHFKNRSFTPFDDPFFIFRDRREKAVQA